MHSVSRRLPSALFALGALVPAETADRLTVIAGVRPSVYYVGQSVDLSIGVVAERERPSVAMPAVPGADVTLVGTDMKPLSASAIGDAVSEKNLYRTRYRLIPRRAGTLKVPPVPAVLGERRGVSDPVALTIRPPPLTGRPAEFLGGVGSFEVEARAEPTSVQSGEAFEYRVTVRGPGCRGMTGAPDLARLQQTPLGLNVERRPDQAVAEPPSRTFVYRVRPTRVGRLTLPPVGISAFDPKSGRYLTKATPGIPVRVTDVPRFDPAAVRYGPPRSPPRAESNLRRQVRPDAVRAMTVLAAATISGFAVLVWKKRQSGRRRGASRLARDTLSRLARVHSAHEQGRLVTEALIAYLALTIGRPRGVLTPIEAEEGVARATGSEDLARRAHGLIARCDEVLYDTDPLGPGDRRPPVREDVSAIGRALFRDLAARRGVRSERDDKAREGRRGMRQVGGGPRGKR